MVLPTTILPIVDFEHNQTPYAWQGVGILIMIFSHAALITPKAAVLSSEKSNPLSFLSSSPVRNPDRRAIREGGPQHAELSLLARVERLSGPSPPF